jgi:LPXTG-site transpeptidase (sortase) family protein
MRHNGDMRSHRARLRPRRAALCALIVVGALLAASGGTHPGVARAATVDRGARSGEAAGDELNPIVDDAAFPAAAVNPLDPDPLPVPERPPDDPHANVPVPELGTIEIPAIGLVHTVYEGVTLTAINRGPGHWPGTALPGQRGNTVFPGHRTTYSHPFGDLDLLEPGDEITFRMPDGVHTYAVAETLIVHPTELWVVDQTETPTVTLIACHPKGSAAQRIVVKGELVRSEPSLAAVAAALRLADLSEQLPL